MNYTTKQLEGMVKKKYPYVYRNNRGSVIKNYVSASGKKSTRKISFGIPEPRANETDDDFKGGDFIGFYLDEDLGLSIFTNIEIKGPGDKIKDGQVRWHNFIINAGGISEIWKSDGTIIEWVTTKEEVNR